MICFSSQPNEFDDILWGTLAHSSQMQCNAEFLICGAVSVLGVQTHMPLVSSNGVSLQIAWPHLSSGSNLAALLHLQYDSQSTSWQYHRSYGPEFSVAQLQLAPYLSRMWAGHALSWFFFFCLWILACVTSNFAHVYFNVFSNIFAFFFDRVLICMHVHVRLFVWL